MIWYPSLKYDFISFLDAQFSDWWACFAHKYQKVEVTDIFKYRNVWKVSLPSMPEIDKELPP